MSFESLLVGVVRGSVLAQTAPVWNGWAGADSTMQAASVPILGIMAVFLIISFAGALIAVASGRKSVVDDDD
jgi:ACR3 family arsenite efflux pump ArsB